MTTKRHNRYLDIIPRKKIDLETACVVGVGAIGRQVALQLGIIGVPKIILIDHDKVEEHNLGSQGYPPGYDGTEKVFATSLAIEDLNPDIETIPIVSKYKPQHVEGATAMFICVDSIGARRYILNNTPKSVHFYCDGRMAAESFGVFTSIYGDYQDYQKTFFSQDEAYKAPCTSRTTIYCANICAGFMLAQFTRFLRDFEPEPVIQFNILAMERMD